MTEGNVMKKGGKVKAYKDGGAISESKVANLPAKGAPKKPDFNAGKAKIASYKTGGASSKPMRKAAGRGR